MNEWIKSDSKPSYKALVQSAYPKQIHETHVARANKEKKRDMNYTSLEKRVFYPIFAVNQRMAKFRDHIKRLARRSWCTTKTRNNLEKHSYLYIADNNGYALIWPTSLSKAALKYKSSEYQTTIFYIELITSDMKAQRELSCLN